MLQELAIKNFAIIEDLRIRFQPGLTIFSGETGAGKSIIINAVSLLLGARASARLIRTGSESAELEALFQIAPDSAAGLTMARLGYAAEDGLVVRRIIRRDESNRIYINGALATVAVLTALTGHLASISGQHAHQSLLREDQHLLIIDRFGGLMERRRALAEAYHRLLPLLAERQRLESRTAHQTERVELLKFQRGEIEAARIQPEEDSLLAQERQRLRHAETLMQALGGGIDVLYGADGSSLEQVAAVAKTLERAAQIDPQFSSMVGRLKEIGVLITDLAEEMRDCLGTLQVDERRLEQVEDRLEALGRLKKKYGGSLAGIGDYLTAIERELGDMSHLDEALAQNRQAIEAERTLLAEICRCLSTERREAAVALARRVEEALGDLRMAETRFEVALDKFPADGRTDPRLTLDGALIGETGVDQATFMMAANVGEALKPMAAIASGGELSRVVLALKAILAATESLETVVFDEVDAGIGGAVAEVVGRQLKGLAAHHQLICITHLPQIAKFGDHHFRIAKTVAGGRTRTTIEPLDGKGRIEEIARMLGGETIGDQTLAHARELLSKS